MKKIALFLLAVFSLGQLHAQDAKSFYKTPYKSRNSGSFAKGDFILSVGYGFPNLSGSQYSLPGFYNNRQLSGFGPVYLKAEYGIMDEVGVGLYNATSIFQYKYRIGNNTYKDNGNAVSFGALGYYHFNKLIPVAKLDVYAGLGAAIRIINYHYDNSRPLSPSDDSDFNALPVVKVGARYYFTDKFAVYGEAGYDNMSSVNFGVSFRF